MDLREFYDEFVTRWYNGDTSCAFVRKCRSLLEEEAQFFETVLQQVRGCEDPHEEYNLVCDEVFADGRINMGRLCALFAFSIVVAKVFPNIQELLVAQLKKRQVEIEKLKKWE